MASELGLSVHTINARLRKARRKLQVTSSKEAARLLLDGEGAEHKPLVSIDLGGDPPGGNTSDEAAPEHGGKARLSLVWIIGGLLIMIPFLATIALLTFTPGNDLRETTAEPAAVSQNDGAKTACAWQALLDAGDWEASWDKTAQSFQDLNTLGEWAQASQEAGRRWAPC